MSLTRYLNGLTGRMAAFSAKVSLLEHQKEVITAALATFFSRKELDLASFRSVVERQEALLEEIGHELEEYISQEEKLGKILEHYELRDETTVRLMRDADKALKETSSSLPRMKGILQKQMEEADRNAVKKLLGEEKRMVEGIMRHYHGLIETGLKASNDMEDRELFSAWKNVKATGIAMVFYALSLTIATSNVLAVEHAKADNKAVDMLVASVSIPRLTNSVVSFFEDTHVIGLIRGVIEARKTYKEGVATVYADYFHGRKTASGDIFRHDRVSCAVPIGSRLFKGYKRPPLRLRIRNLENGKEIVAPVTDVGNFGWNEKKRKYNKYRELEGEPRIVDLSQKAFAELAGVKSFGHSKDRALKVEIAPIYD